MNVLVKEEIFTRKEYYLRELKKNVFIYPTDTIYGVGCDATNGVLVDKIRELKERAVMPFSVIAPSKNWIRTMCIITQEAEEWLAKLPGPYTLILPLKKPEELARGVTQGKDTLGVRIPNHWFSEVVSLLNIPVVTTSANRSGENYMRTIDDLSAHWKEIVKYTIYEGECMGSPSTIIDLTGTQTNITKR